MTVAKYKIRRAARRLKMADHPSRPVVAAFPRKQAGLPKSVLHQLSLYVTAASAAGVGLLASSQPVQAQVVFTPANQQIGPNQKLSIDFNHDGLTDLILREIPYQWNGPYHGNSVRALPHSGGGIKQGYGQGFAQAMSRGARIGPKEFFLEDWAIIARTYSIYYNGSWTGVTDHYLGVRFLIDGKLHYGWARLNVSNWGITVTLTGYAYQTQPGVSIAAGQTGLEDDDEAANEIPAVHQSAEKATLGALALGADSLKIWRQEEF
jgi:hypothetical protein